MEDIPKVVGPNPIRFTDKLRVFIRERNLAYATEQTYLSWIMRFIRFHDMKHPEDMRASHVEQFLNHLSVQRNCSDSTQRTALNTLFFCMLNF